MPKLYDRMVSQIKAQGRDENAAHAIATAQGQKFGLFKKGTRELTAKGKKQEKAGAAKRAKKRAKKRSKGKHKTKDYKYNPRNNVASLKTEETLLECWSTHVQQGYKMKGGKRVPNCVPRSSVKTEDVSIATRLGTLIVKSKGKRERRPRVKEGEFGYEIVQPTVPTQYQGHKFTGKRTPAEVAKMIRDARAKNDPKLRPRLVKDTVMDSRTPCSSCGQNLTEGKNKPTNPSLWSRAKALAKKKFDVYPSAYANAWAAKWYKKRGGGWKKG